MDKIVEKLTFSPNGVYMVTVVEGQEHLYHLSSPWDMTTITHQLVGNEYHEVVKKLLGRC